MSMINSSKLKERILKGTKLDYGVTPSYSGLGLANIIPTIAKILGAPIKGQYELIDDIVNYEEYKDIKQVVFLLADGIGYEQLLWEMKQQDLNMIEFKDDLLPITSVYPSATSIALTTLATGVTPQEHGIMGYKLFLKEFGLIASMLTFSPVLGYVDFMSLGIDPGKFIGIDTVYKHMKSNGIDSHVILPKKYVNSGLSHMIYRNTNIIGYKKYTNAFSKAKKLVKAKNNRKKFIYIYWDLFDMEAHLHGVKTDETSKAVKMLDKRLFNDFLDRVSRKDTLFILSADHGFINVDMDETYFFHEHEDLMDMLIIPPSGEQRFTYLFTKHGKLDDVKDYINTNLKKQAFVIESSKAIKMGLFGNNEPRKETLNRIGDLILIPKNNNVFTYAYTIEDILFRLKGQHGGISEEEMLVPLIMKRL